MVMVDGWMTNRGRGVHHLARGQVTDLETAQSTFILEFFYFMEPAKVNLDALQM